MINARRIRVRRITKASDGTITSDVTYTLVSSDTQYNITLAKFPSMEAVRIATQESYNSLLGEFLVQLGMGVEERTNFIENASYEETSCIYTCILTTVDILAITPTSVTLKGNVNSSLLFGGIEFEKNGDGQWFAADESTGNTFTFLGLTPDTNYTFRVRERFHPSCVVTVTQKTNAPEYVTVVYDFVNSNSPEKNDISQLKINGTTYNNPVANITQQVLVGTNLVISIFPVTDVLNSDFGWVQTTVLKVVAAGETDKTATGNINTATQVAVQFVPLVANRVYTITVE